MPYAGAGIESALPVIVAFVQAGALCGIIYA